MKSRYDIIISGGGMVGLALACSLSEHDYTIALIEPDEIKPYKTKQVPDLRVSALNLGSQKLLEKLGAWQTIVENRISPFTRMQVWDAGGSGSIDFGAMEYSEQALGYIVENRLVQWALYNVCEKHNKIDNITSSIESIVSGEKDTIVTLENKTVLICSLLAGADGQHSTVREQCAFEIDSRDYGQNAIVANVKCEHKNEQTAYQRFLENGVLAFLPMADGSSSIVWSAETVYADHLIKLDDQAFSAVLEKTFDYKLGRITDCSQRAIFPLSGRHARHYVKQGIALLGDAAHTVHPLAGQGVNLGFQDVRALTSVLSEGQREPGSYHLLRKYERQRRGENELILRSMEGFKLLFNNTNPLISFARNTGLDLVNHIHPLKALFVRAALGQYH